MRGVGRGRRGRGERVGRVGRGEWEWGGDLGKERREEGRVKMGVIAIIRMNLLIFPTGKTIWEQFFHVVVKE